MLTGLSRRRFVRDVAGAAGLLCLTGRRAVARSAAASQRFNVGYQIFGWGRYFPAAWWRGAGAVGALGYPGIEGEYTISQLYDGREDEFAERMEACGVALAALYSTTDLERPHERVENVRKNLQAARFLARHGGETIVMGGTQAVRKDADAFRTFCAVANDLGRRTLEDHGVRCAYHPHLGAIVETREDISRVMDGTDARWFFLAPDTGHLAAAGADVVEVFRTYGSRVVHAHLKDYVAAPRPGQRGTFVPLGAGAVDFKALVALLRQTGFAGWLNVEMDGGRGLDPAEVARAAHAYVTETLALSLRAATASPEVRRRGSA